MLPFFAEITYLLLNSLKLRTMIWPTCAENLFGQTSFLILIFPISPVVGLLGHKLEAVCLLSVHCLFTLGWFWANTILMLNWKNQKQFMFNAVTWSALHGDTPCSDVGKSLGKFHMLLIFFFLNWKLLLWHVKTFGHPTKWALNKPNFVRYHSLQTPFEAAKSICSRFMNFHPLFLQIA